MGLNTGTVVVGKIGDNLRMDYTAIGDTTNLAARLQGIAAAWHNSHERIDPSRRRAHFEFQTSADIRLKGISDRFRCSSRSAYDPTARSPALEYAPADVAWRVGRSTQQGLERTVSYTPPISHARC